MKSFFFWNRPAADPASSSEPGRPGADEEPASSLLTGDPGRDENFLRTLLDSIADVSSDMDLQRVLMRIVDKSLEVTSAERAVLFLGSDADDLEVSVARDSVGDELGKDLQYSRTIVGRSVGDQTPIRSVVQSDQQALEIGQSVFDLKLRAVMCAPLLGKNGVLGAIYVDSRAARREFSSRDLALFGALSAQLAIALDNARLYSDSIEKVRLEKDVEIARKIQQHLLPPIPEGVPGLDVAVRFRACDEASGDSYDLMRLGENKLAVTVGDVTGHGVGAALLTHSAQAALRSYLELIDDPSEVVVRLNNRLVAGVESGMFMSLLVAIVDEEAHTLQLVNAGHAELLLVGEGGVQEYGKTGMVLGVVGDSEYQVTGPVSVQPGDLIFVRTDGVDETRNSQREVFGDQRLKDALLSARGESAEGAMLRVEEALEEHAGGHPQEDDVTMIMIKVER